MMTNFPHDEFQVVFFQRLNINGLVLLSVPFFGFLNHIKINTVNRGGFAQGGVKLHRA
jgi:hypothetical protein